MKRRQLKDQILPLLKEIKEKHKEEAESLSLGGSPNYEALVDAVAACWGRGLLSTEVLTGKLDQAELAGKQHVILFKVPEEKVELTRQRLAAKTSLLARRGVKEFLKVPTSTTAYLLADTAEEIVVKLVGRRLDWVEHVREKRDDWEVIERRRVIERTSIIIKFASVHNVLQIRVPPRGGFGVSETSRKVYLVALAVLDSAYGKEGTALLQDVSAFPLDAAYAKLVKNRTDFIMLSDSPENPHFRAMFAGRGARGVQDIRDLKDYSFDKSTFARTMMRGGWKTDEEVYAYTTMHWEKVKTSSNAQRDIARIYFPHMNTDAEVERVIGRICDHAF